MKAQEVARRRLRNTGLTGDRFQSPHEIVAWHGAMQAQEYGLAKWSIGQRASGAVDQDVDQALEGGSIVRTHVLRATWHFVAAPDIRWMLALTAPRVRRHVASRFLELGLDQRTLVRCETVFASALAGNRTLTREELGRVLVDAGVDTAGQRLPFILLHGELEGLICSGGLSGKQHTYALFDDRVPKSARFDRDEALVELVRRYLQSHGPATAQDLGWWSSLPMADVRNGLHLLGSAVRSEIIDGTTFWLLSTDTRTPRSSNRLHLLQLYDEALVGYTESRFFGDPREATARAAWRDRSLPSGVLLIENGVGGHWKRTAKKDVVTLEAFLYEEPSSDILRRLEAAAAEMGRFLGREARVELRSLDRRR
ncbi:MAG TPA: winged helix DNA-binding domain-containing protein [Actinomycetota bacterium]|nr:winged helix DNA-binding domain-containing protein [Actinomycetota bacterium]